MDDTLIFIPAKTHRQKAVNLRVPLNQLAWKMILQDMVIFSMYIRNKERISC